MGRARNPGGRKTANHKPIFPILLADEAWSRLGDLQYEDATAGLAYHPTPQFVEELGRVAPRFTGEQPPPPLPIDESLQIRVPKPGPSRALPLIPLGIIGAIAVIMFLGAELSGLFGNKGTATPPLSTPITQVASATLASAVTNALTDTLAAQTAIAALSSPTLTPAATHSAIPTKTPTVRATDTPFSVDDFIAQTKAAFASRTANVIASYTKTPTRTPTATATFTHTPDIQKSIEAAFTSTAQQEIANAIASFTHTFTPTATFTPSATDTPTATLSPTPLPAGFERTDPTGIKQVWVPAGCFAMGSDPKKDSYGAQNKNEQPQHQVCLTAGYWIDAFDVTNAAFDAFVQAGGYNTDAYWSTNGLAWRNKNSSTSTPSPATDCTKYSSDAKQPRICVSWYEAEAYANWRTATAKDGLTYRLPSEAEWEYAARGSQSPIYPWVDAWDGKKANTYENRIGKTTAVDAYPNGKSWVGAYDMAGNVWQWMADCYDSKFYTGRPNPDNDPVNNCNITDNTARALRGGSWLDTLYGARAAFRFSDLPFDHFNVVGFRLVVRPF